MNWVDHKKEICLFGLMSIQKKKKKRTALFSLSLPPFLSPFKRLWFCVCHTINFRAFGFVCRCQKFQMRLQTPVRKCHRSWRTCKSTNSTRRLAKMSLIPAQAALKRHPRLRPHHRNRQVFLIVLKILKAKLTQLEATKKVEYSQKGTASTQLRFTNKETKN